jgi:type I restriction enzyme S subunit
MGGEWAEERFGNLVQCVSDKCQVKEVSVENYISTENMVPNFGGITLASRVPLAGSVTKFSVGDTLFSNIRTYFKKVWQAQFDGYCSNDVLVFRSANDEVLAQDYLHQICRWERFTELSVRTSKGAKMPRGDKSAIADFKFLLPPINEQRAIAHILGTLDDKIELNRRRNQALEAMARALFKDWFVDFGPVRAKMEGREPYLPADLWQLFPDRLDDEGKPEGWEIKRIGDVIERLGVGKKYDQKTVKPSGAVPVLDQGKTGIIGFHDDEPGVVASENKPVVVFANHTCYMRLVHFPFSAIQNVLPFIGKGVNTIWAYFATLGKQSFVEYKGHWPDFVIHDVVVSSSELTEKFAILAQPLVQRIWANDSESRTLAQLRDTLLPKLISGEMRIKDADKFLEHTQL